MSDHDNFDTGAGNRVANAPYTSHHPVPTVQRYEEQQQHREDLARPADSSRESEPNSTSHAIKSYLHFNGGSHTGTAGQNGTPAPYKSQNQNDQHDQSAETPHERGSNSENQSNTKDEADSVRADSDGHKSPEDTQQTVVNEQDPKKKRKSFKHMKRDDQGREVTDPVTHLPVTIHDSTDQELKNVPENPTPAGSDPRSATGPRGASKSDSQLSREHEEAESEHKGMQRLFPPPDFQAMKHQISSTYKLAITVGLSLTMLASCAPILINYVFLVNGPRSWPYMVFSMGVVPFLGLAIGAAVILGLRSWTDHKVDGIWDDGIWAGSRAQEEKQYDDLPIPESVQWLNSLLASVWPLINPDLFTSLSDTLEDVMQASLPKLVRMISVEDLGQGSESIRILGIRWLPTGAAARSVSADGQLKSGDNDDSDRKAPGQGEVEDDTKPTDTDKDQGKPSSVDKQDENNDENVAEGMEAEQGDFVNMEVAFSYRATSSGKGIKKKAKNAHLYLVFYLPGGFRFPVWVEVQGIVGTLRMRLQLVPDPPFFSLCTLTLLGQPKASLSCVPLTRRGLNIMDLPIISSFVQSSIDAALAEYVAPKSLTLDLKDMLEGDDFKKDTQARGAIMVRIKRAANFKEGDGNLGGLKKGSSDPYVSVGWAKFGKPVWSTRVILKDMEPVWDETAFILVTQEELNAEERLRVHLWDSDRGSADDDLGRIEVDLKEIMQHSASSNGRMWDREDGFIAMDADEKMPGTLQWSVGYFRKVKIQEEQLAKQTAEPDIKTIKALKDKVSEQAARKLREAPKEDASKEIELQKAQDLKAREDQLVISSPPPDAYPTGILSIQIHNITGLQFEKMNKEKDDEGDDSENIDGDLPSSYCTVIVNHQKTFKTRTKPKNSEPFFNASTERLIRDWRTTEVMVAVSDARIHENDALLGIIYLPLAHMFNERCQTVDNYPLVGGIGYGRARISMVFRSIQLQIPKELLGWDYGTIEVTGPITSKGLPEDLRGLRIKLRTSINRGKMYDNNTEGKWTAKKDRNVCLAVRKRYCSALVIEFRKNRAIMDKTPAIAILWLKDIPDEEETTVTLTVWRGMDLKRAENNCLEEMGERVGTINVPLKLWHGLSNYHRRLMSKSPTLKDVFEVLDTASDNKEIRDVMDEDDPNDSDSSDSGVSDLIPTALKGGDDEELQTSGKRGPIDQIKDYKDNRKQLHRQQRGIMQYKGARTLKWMKTKVDHGKDHIANTFHHHERDPGIETEV
ncbi:hypothetical protein MMC19_000699 [Ptychographa xylographoides]|nr:hypothetical protein [Ptychographa xylographoides]